MEKNIELEKDKCNDENKWEKDYDNEYNELGIIINQQGILSQKVAILMTINFLILGFIITLSSIFCWYISFVSFYFIFPLGINIYILFPNFHSLENSKYFLDYKDFSIEKINKHINNKNNILYQIKTNSSILFDKYKLFELSLSWTAFFFPYIFKYIFIFLNYILIKTKIK